MLLATRYSDPDYVLDQGLTEELQYRRESGGSNTLPQSRAVTIITPIALFLLVWPFTHVLIAVGVATHALAISLVVQINREGNAITADCPSCGNSMLKVEEGNAEYFVCHGCKRYAKGRDWR